MKAFIGRAAGFPWFWTLFSLWAAVGLGARGIAAFVKGQFHVPFTSTLITMTAHPLVFYSGACLLIILSVLCLLGLYDTISTWRKSGERTQQLS